MIRRLALVTCLLSMPALAGEIACPDMTAAVQLGDCPTEQDLKWGFDGYCGDNARIYDKANPEGDTCTDMELYKKLKNVALWEAGEFQGYLHCSRTAEQHKAAKPVKVTVGKAGTMTRVACVYDGGEEMSLRTRSACSVKDGKAVCE